MLSRKQLRFVPDRRQHVRILTIRNFAIFLAVAVVAILAVNAISELHAPHGTDYGRIFSQQDPEQSMPKPAPQVVVHEAPVPDNDRADSTLLAPMARSQYLGDPQLEPQVKVNPAQVLATPVQTATETPKVQIVGGSNGVNIVHSATPATPKLSGGIFKNEN